MRKYSELKPEIKQQLKGMNIKDDGTPCNDSMFKKSIAAGFDPQMILAKQGKDVVGWAADFEYGDDAGYPFNYFGNHTRMYYVKPSERKKGIGKRLGKAAQKATNIRSTVCAWDAASYGLSDALARIQ